MSFAGDDCPDFRLGSVVAGGGAPGFGEVLFFIGSLDCGASCCASAFAAASDCAIGNGLLAAGSVSGVDFDPVFEELCDFAVFVCVEDDDWDDCFWVFAEGASGGGLWLLCCRQRKPTCKQQQHSNQQCNPATRLFQTLHTYYSGRFLAGLGRRIGPMQKNSRPCGCYTPSSASNIRMGLIVRSSFIHAAGCYTTTPIAKGTRVVEYTGPIIDKEEADRRYEHKPITYLFGIGDGSRVIDGHGIAMFINHSCDANCETEEIDDRVWIMAIRNIAAGEELCYDYCLYDGGEEEAPCNCGAKNCRGSMYSAEELRRRKRLAAKQAKEQAAAQKKQAKSATRRRNERDRLLDSEKFAEACKNIRKEAVAAEDFDRLRTKEIHSRPKTREKSPRKVIFAARQSSRTAPWRIEIIPTRWPRAAAS